MRHIKKFNESVLNSEYQSLNMRDFAQLVGDGNVWLCAIEGSGSGYVNTKNYEIQRIDISELLELNDVTIVLVDEDGFDSVPATLRNKCSLAIIPEIPNYIKNDPRIFKLF